VWVSVFVCVSVCKGEGGGGKPTHLGDPPADTAAVDGGVVVALALIQCQSAKGMWGIGVG
jgi:hypothetical protein